MIVCSVVRQISSRRERRHSPRCCQRGCRLNIRTVRPARRCVFLSSVPHACCRPEKPTTQSQPHRLDEENAAQMSPLRKHPSRTLPKSALAGDIGTPTSIELVTRLRNACQPRPLVSYLQELLRGFASWTSPDSLWLLWLVHRLPDSRLRHKADLFT